MSIVSNESQHSNNDFKINDNVDDMFVNFDISNIQLKAKQYEKIIKQNKEKLHSLVGNKYRDLIKIAEDINSISQLNLNASDKIKSLSYRSSAFTSSYDDKYGKFDTLIRDKNMIQSQRNSRSIIVRNIVHKKLDKLNDKIDNNEGSPVIHASSLIHYSKIYYTLETIFADVFENDANLKYQFSQLKNKFNSYLEFEIASYCLLNPVLNVSDDIFRPNQRIKLADLILKDDKVQISKAFHIYEIDEYSENDYTLKTDEDVTELQEIDESGFTNKDNYDSHTPAIFNYLLSYDILNGGIPDLGAKMMEVRTTFIQQLLQQVSNKSINVFNLLKYFECTCLYLNTYFDDFESQYFVALSKIIQPWSSISLIGYKYWHDEQLISFENNKTKNLNHENLLNKTREWLFHYVADFVKIKSSVNFNRLEMNILSYHNILISLSNLDDLVKSLSTKSEIVSVISKSQFLQTLTTALSESISRSQLQHVSQLNDASNGIVRLFKEGLTSQNDSEHNSLFSIETVTLMDSNLDLYMDMLTTKRKSTALKGLQNWFDESNKYRSLLSYGQNRTKESTSNCLEYIISKTKIKWGSFSNENIKTEVKNVNEATHEHFCRNIKLFLKTIKDISESITQKEQIFYVIQVLTSIKSNLDQDDLNNDEIEELSGVQFERLIYMLPTEEFFEKFKNSIDDKLNSSYKVRSFNGRPSSEIVSQMYLLNKAYRDLGNLESFTGKNSSESFIKSKNKWLKKTLIQDQFMKQITKKSQRKQINNEVDEKEVKESNLDRSQLLQILADYVFLLSFCQKPIERSDINSTLEILKTIGRDNIEETDLSNTIEKVKSHYKSTKNIYLPLSLN